MNTKDSKRKHIILFKIRIKHNTIKHIRQVKRIRKTETKIETKLTSHLRSMSA